jgi:hypothetical protein
MRRASTLPAAPSAAALPPPAGGEAGAHRGESLAEAAALCLSPPPGALAAVLGPGACALALRALAAPLLAGETVTAVDGGNRFDPHAVARAASALGGSAALALSRLRLSRAFTCHQLEALLSARLPAELARSSSTAVLVLGLPESFRDADVPFPEACRLFRRSLSALSRLSRGGARVLLAAESWEGDRQGFLLYLARRCRPLLLVRREGAGTAWTLAGR